jgi:hypothetical protein
VNGTAGEPFTSFELGVLMEEYAALCGRLRFWRFDSELASARSQILGFVRGLRFSALLIYRIRKLLLGTDLKANWGAIDSEGRLSPECDIIIHKSGPPRTVWDGGDDVGGCVMDFWFVRREEALIVISCKSKLDSVDVSYPAKLKPYVDHLWLFAECCEQREVQRHQAHASEAGYERFWYLYAITDTGMTGENVPGWVEFARELKQLSSGQ